MATRFEWIRSFALHAAKLFHPNPALGLKVEDVMGERPVNTINAHAPISDVVRCFRKEGKHGYVVLFDPDKGATYDEIMKDPKLKERYREGCPHGEGDDVRNNGAPVGVLSSTAVLHYESDILENPNTPAIEFWKLTGRTQVHTVTRLQMMAEVLRMMVENRCQRLPVVFRDGYMRTVVTLDDVLDMLMTPLPIWDVRDLERQADFANRARKIETWLTTTTVEQVPRKADPIQVKPETPWADAQAATQKSELKGIAVLDDDRRPVGIITPTDAVNTTLAELADGGGFDRHMPVRELMKNPVDTTPVGTPVFNVLAKLHQTGRHRDVIVDADGRFVTFISRARIFAGMYNAVLA